MPSLSVDDSLTTCRHAVSEAHSDLYDIAQFADEANVLAVDGLIHGIVRDGPVVATSASARGARGQVGIVPRVVWPVRNKQRTSAAQPVTQQLRCVARACAVCGRVLVGPSRPTAPLVVACASISPVPSAVGVLQRKLCTSLLLIRSNSFRARLRRSIATCTVNVNVVQHAYAFLGFSRKASTISVE